jgi:microcin C transport system permease protein
VPGRNLVLQPSFWLLVVILAAFGWMTITYYVRGEYYREKAKDYVGAAIALGVSERVIMFRHILPNALTPVVSFAPFVIVANIVALVALDFLGFGLPAPTPSWGELIGQGTEYLTKWWLVFFPLGAVFATLLLIVFIGEAVREAFDPKEYSRLR